MANKERINGGWHTKISVNQITFYLRASINKEPLKNMWHNSRLVTNIPHRGKMWDIHLYAAVLIWVKTYQILPTEEKCTDTFTRPALYLSCCFEFFRIGLISGVGSNSKVIYFLFLFELLYRKTQKKKTQYLPTSHKNRVVMEYNFEKCFCFKMHD